jgi:hypothetical protein
MVGWICVRDGEIVWVYFSMQKLGFGILQRFQ